MMVCFILCVSLSGGHGSNEHLFSNLINFAVQRCKVACNQGEAGERTLSAWRRETETAVAFYDKLSGKFVFYGWKKTENIFFFLQQDVTNMTEY